MNAPLADTLDRFGADYAEHRAAELETWLAEARARRPIRARGDTLSLQSLVAEV